MRFKEGREQKLLDRRAEEIDFVTLDAIFEEWGRI